MAKKASGSAKQPYTLEKVISEKKFLGDGVNFDTKYECIEGKSDLVIGHFKLTILGVTLPQCEELSKRMEALIVEYHGLCAEENRALFEAQKEKELAGQLL